MSSRATVLFLALVAAVPGLFAGTAHAQVQGSAAQRLGDMIFGAPDHEERTSATPAVARYRSDSGDGFVLDVATTNAALLKFDGSPEVWVLRPTPGPRGDVIYKNDLGEPMIRATRLGGLTLFTPERPQGMAAAFAREAAPPRSFGALEPEVLLQIFVQASTRASRAARHLVVFEGPQDLTTASAPVFADAAVVCSQAFTQVEASSKQGQTLLARFQKVLFLSGRAPGAGVQGTVVRITVTPELGLAGRPSSRRIASVISHK